MIAAQAPAPVAAEPEKPASPAAPQARAAAPSTSAGGAVLQRCGAAGCRGSRPGADPSDAGGDCGCSSGAATARARIDGDDALGRMLARSVAQRAASAPHYKDSETEAPGVRHPDRVLDAARRQAMRFVAAAQAALAAPPQPRSTYGRALRRHFITPTPAEHAQILQNYNVIATSLVVENYVVTRGLTPVDGDPNPCANDAYYRRQDDLIYICPRFWNLTPFCQALTLIHEGAHDANVDAHFVGHAPNRGSGSYPTAGGGDTPSLVATADRMASPDAYGFFAAHIATGHDAEGTCFATPRRRR